MAEITVHALLPHQLPIADSPARFKVVRAGRRFGKDALAENISLLGHGPETDGEPEFRGLRHGLDVVWLAPTIPQASAMWKNEVEPRFRNKDSIETNRVEKTVTLLNPDGSAYATLWVRSAEAIHSIRGIGKKLAGVVINEAAWMDLETAWRDVIRPTLMDCHGWAVIMSTTNGGPDGYQDEAGKRSPSFFNILCEEIQSGKRGPEWAEFYGTAADNPKIRAGEFRALVEEYPADSVTLAQEVYAKLVVGGAGLAFPQWEDRYHIATYEPPRHSGVWSVAGDWGYEKPGGLWLIWTGAERSLVRHEYYFRRTQPYDVGEHFGRMLQRYPQAEFGTFDEPPVSDGGQTIMERVQAGLDSVLGPLAPILIHPPKGPGSRHAGYMAMHEALKFTADENDVVHPWAMPKLQWHPDCHNAIRCISRLPKDPKGKEDVDTDAEDHPFDAKKGWLLNRAPSVAKHERKTRDPDEHHVFPEPRRSLPDELPPQRVHWTREPVGRGGDFRV